MFVRWKRSDLVLRACVITDGRAPDIASLYDADGCSGSASSLEPYLHSPAHVTWSLAADWLSGDVGGAWPDTWRIPAQLAVGEDVSFSLAWLRHTHAAI